MVKNRFANPGGAGSISGLGRSPRKGDGREAWQRDQTQPSNSMLFNR